jgi:hypothetical protein
MDSYASDLKNSGGSSAGASGFRMSVSTETSAKCAYNSSEGGGLQLEGASSINAKNPHGNEAGCKSACCSN